MEWVLWLLSRRLHGLLCSAMLHPHVVRMQSILRTPSFVCLKLEHCNGGCLFTMIRQSGQGGLPLPAANFLMQQVTLATTYLHRFDRYLSSLTPHNLLAHWNDRGIPLVKLIPFSFPDSVRPSRACTACFTCAHALEFNGERKRYQFTPHIQVGL